MQLSPYIKDAHDSIRTYSWVFLQHICLEACVSTIFFDRTKMGGIIYLSENSLVFLESSPTEISSFRSKKGSEIRERFLACLPAEQTVLYCLYCLHTGWPRVFVRVLYTRLRKRSGQCVVQTAQDYLFTRCLQCDVERN